MHLATAEYFKDAGFTPMQSNLEAGWRELSKGLGLVVRGYCVLIAGGILGPALIWWTAHPASGTSRLDAGTQNRDILLLCGVLTLGLTALLSYGLVLAGQWRCLMYAPERQNAKEL